MATYYIDPGGNDGTGDGSFALPWTTLKKACSVATSGDIVHVNAGTYDGLDGTTTAVLAVGVKIEGEGDTSILTYSGAVSTYRAITAESVAQGTAGNNEISYLKFDGNALTMPTGIRIRNRGNFLIHHCTFVNINYAAIDNYNGDGSALEPTDYATGCEVHDCTITNCSRYLTGVTSGSIQIGGQDGLLIYSNDIQNVAAGVDRGIPIKGYSRWHKRLKIYHNTIKKIHTGNNLPFAIELWDGSGEIEIYNNTIWGDTDIVRCTKGGLSYGMKFYNNIVGEDSSPTKSFPGIGQEWSSEGIYIFQNLFKNLTTSISFKTGGGSTVIDDIHIYYNIFQNVGCLNDTIQYQRAFYFYSEYYTCVLTDVDDRVTFTGSIYHTFVDGAQIRFSEYTGSLPPGVDTTTVYTIINAVDYNFQISTDGVNPIDFGGDSSPAVRIQSIGVWKNIYIENNIIEAKIPDGTYPPQAAIHGSVYGSIDNLNIQNNIFTGFSVAPIWFQGGASTGTNWTIKNNIFYDNGNSNDPLYDYTFAPDPVSYVYSGTIKDDPKWVTPYSDHSLQDDSPAIDAGLDLGYVADFIGTLVPQGAAPDIGAYEWFALPSAFSNITLVSTPACYDPVDPTIVSRWVATECPINFRLLRRDWYVISCAESGGYLAVNIYGTFAGVDGDIISLYDLTTNSMYTGTIDDSSGAPTLITDIDWVDGMDIKYLNDHTFYAGYYFEGRLTINGIVEPLTIIASPDSFGYADLDVSAILRTKTRIGKLTNYLNRIMADTYKSGNFTLEYRGRWWGSAEAWTQEGSITSPPSTVVWYYAECVRSIEQGCNLSEYVPTDLSEAKWLNQFETPVYWYGLPFDISFILPEMADLSPAIELTVTTKVYDSENFQLGADIVEYVDVDDLEGYVNNLAVDSTLIPVGASYFTVEITAP